MVNQNNKSDSLQQNNNIISNTSDDIITIFFWVAIWNILNDHLEPYDNTYIYTIYAIIIIVYIYTKYY